MSGVGCGLLPSEAGPSFPFCPSYSLYHLHIFYVSYRQPLIIVRTVQSINTLNRDYLICFLCKFILFSKLNVFSLRKLFLAFWLTVETSLLAVMYMFFGIFSGLYSLFSLYFVLFYFKVQVKVCKKSQSFFLASFFNDCNKSVTL